MNYSHLTSVLAILTLLVFSSCDKQELEPLSPTKSAQNSSEKAAPNESTTSSNRNGALYINDEPTFLVGYFSSGLYDDPDRREMLREMEVAGFNVMHSVDEYGDDLIEYRSFLDEAEQRGVHILHSLQKDPRDVDLYRDHPAIIGWYVDDVQIHYPTDAAARELHQIIKAKDPDRIDFFSVGFTTTGPDFYAIADAGQRQYYPIKPNLDWDLEKQRSFGKLVDIVDRCRASDKIPQFAMQTSPAIDATLFPSGTQIDLLSYLGIVAGMQGIMYWEYEDNSLPGIQAVRETQPEMYAATKRIAREAAAMSWVYTAYRKSIVRTAHSNTVYSATWRGANDRSYVVIVNVSTGPRQVTVELPGGTSGTLRKLFEDRPGGLTYDASANQLTGLLQAESVYVYKIH